MSIVNLCTYIHTTECILSSMLLSLTLWYHMLQDAFHVAQFNEFPFEFRHYILQYIISWTRSWTEKDFKVLNNTCFPHLIYVTWTNLLPIKEVIQSLMGNINSEFFLKIYLMIFSRQVMITNSKLDSLLSYHHPICKMLSKPNSRFL